MEKTPTFYMLHYKTVMCPLKLEHNRIHCVYAHNQQDFRRSLFKNDILAYGPKECKNWIKNQKISYYIEGGCQKMINCKHSHGWKEHDYHILVYKIRRCK